MPKLSRRAAIDQPLNYHKRTFAAIRAHDGEAARQAMREHIIDARSSMSGSGDGCRVSTVIVRAPHSRRDAN